VKNKNKYFRRVGLLVIVSIAIFVAAIVIVGREQNFFRDTMRISTEFQDVKGLKEGNDVRFTGIEVGTVTDLIIISDTSVKVQLSIEKDVAPFIKRSSLASIGNEGLMGNKILIILPGTPDSPPIEQGDELKSIEPIEIDDIMKEIMSSSEKINVVSDNLIGITNKINRGDGIFGKIFTDTTFTRNLDRTSQNISRITGNLIDVSRKLNQGGGIIGKLFTDTVFSAQLDSTNAGLNQIAGNLVDITNKINQGEGIFGRLFTDTALTNNLYLTSKNLEETTGNLYQLTEKLNTRGNAISTLVADTTFADSLQLFMRRLNEAVIEATEASEAVQQSGLIRLFSKDEDKKNKEKDDEKNPGDAIREE
jgi:phospholipid/cholesterol/gamma-HCH transport system substrate-binding protein